MGQLFGVEQNRLAGLVEGDTRIGGAIRGIRIITGRFITGSKAWYSDPRP